MRYQHALVIHRRDLRRDDNTAINAALLSSKQVSPCFIFDPRQVGDGNLFKSARAIDFMVCALAELGKSYMQTGGALSLFEGAAHDVLERILAEHDIDAVFVTTDYTPFAKKRDEMLKRICEKRHVAFETHHDVLLIGDPALVRNTNNAPYQIFTSFFRHVVQVFPVERPQTTQGFFSKKALKGSDVQLLQKYKQKSGAQYAFSPRSEALAILDNLFTLKTYADTRDVPHLSTSRLSAHNKFGTVSIREVYYAMHDTLGAGHSLIRQLYWRDFFTYISYHFPHVYEGAFNVRYNHVQWTGTDEQYERWCEGKTGFPIIDAGMRELNATGYMHNRARMIVASFLTKDLHINWRRGEQYFAQHLIDYDPAVNNGSWQWVAGTGADAAPYFRIFNPWLQQKKFDPECTYIYTWVPELRDVDTKRIHAFHTHGVPEGVAYPAPMVEHAHEAGRAKRLYQVQSPKGT